jgi:hypothetical protein
MKKTKRHNINRREKSELPKQVMTIFQTNILLACMHASMNFLYLLNLTAALASSKARGGGGLRSL